MGVWKKTKNEWMNSKINDFIDFTSELQSAACTESGMSDKDKLKCQKMMNSIRLMFNRYAKN